MNQLRHGCTINGQDALRSGTLECERKHIAMKRTNFIFRLSNSHLRRLARVGLLASVVFAVSTAPVTAQESSRSESIALEGATAAEVQVTMEGGTLHVASAPAEAGTPEAADELLRGEFRFGEERAPDIAYRVENGVGWLAIEQGGGSFFDLDVDEDPNEWALALNPTVPTRLAITVDVGEIDLELDGLQLTGLDLTTNVASTTLDFGGTWEQDLQAQMRGDLGEWTLRLPREVGVRVAIDSELVTIDAGEFSETNGVYVNEAYGTAAVTLDIAIEQDIGDITLELID